MKISLTTGDGRKLAAKLPYESADHVVVEALTCKCEFGREDPTDFGGLRVRGTGKSIESRDTWRADAQCVSCGVHVGVLRVKMDTIFGIEEDERVMHGPWRVY